MVNVAAALLLLATGALAVDYSPAGMIPFVGRPAFSFYDSVFQMLVVVTSGPVDNKLGKLDFYANVTQYDGRVVRANCPGTDYRFEEDSIFLDAHWSLISCIGKFRTSLLGFWSKEPISFKWNALDLSLSPEFGIPVVLSFEYGSDKVDRYDLVGFLV
jgi:hypothetical protein